MALHEIDADLKTAEATLKHWEVEYPKVARREVGAKIVYEMAWAEAMTNIKANLPEGAKTPTIPLLEAEATRICGSERMEKLQAETELDIAKKLIGIAETTLTSIQTRAKLDLIEAGLAR